MNYKRTSLNAINILRKFFVEMRYIDGDCHFDIPFPVGAKEAIVAIEFQYEGDEEKLLSLENKLSRISDISYLEDGTKKSYRDKKVAIIIDGSSFNEKANTLKGEIEIRYHKENGEPLSPEVITKEICSLYTQFFDIFYDISS